MHNLMEESKVMIFLKNNVPQSVMFLYSEFLNLGISILIHFVYHLFISIEISPANSVCPI